MWAQKGGALARSDCFSGPCLSLDHFSGLAEGCCVQPVLEASQERDQGRALSRVTHVDHAS